VAKRLQICGMLVALHGIIRISTFSPLVILLFRERAEAVHYIVVGSAFAFCLALLFVGISMAAGKVFAAKTYQLVISLATTAEFMAATVLLVIGVPSEAYLLLLFGPSPLLVTLKAFVVYSLTRYEMNTY
jgi:hypothetical protein